MWALLFLFWTLTNHLSDDVGIDPQTIFVEGVNFEEDFSSQTIAINSQEQYTSVCRASVDNPDDGKWVVSFHSNDIQDYYLCHTGTGEERDIVPVGLGYSQTVDWGLDFPYAYPSPDGETLIIIGQQDDVYPIYAYNLIDETWVLLGIVDSGFRGGANVCGWTSETTGLVCSFVRLSGSTTVRHFSQFDLTQADSMEYLFYSLGDETLINTDYPSRYVIFRSEMLSRALSGSQNQPIPSCEVTIYDADYRQTFDMGYDCLTLYKDIQNPTLYLTGGAHVYFLSTDDEYASTSTLQQIDLTASTPAINAVFEGEVESILSVSPDGRYVAVLMDDNGTIDFPRWAVSYYCCDMFTRKLPIAIIDTQTQTIVYQSKRLRIYHAEQVTWASDDLFVLLTVKESDEPMVYESEEEAAFYEELAQYMMGDEIFDPYMTYQLQQIQIGNDSVKTLDVMLSKNALDSSIPHLSPDNRYVISDQSKIIDLIAFEEVELFRDGVADDYSIWLDWQSDFLKVILVPNDGSSAHRYHVYLPNE